MPRPVPGPPQGPSISVVIPTRDERGRLRPALETARAAGVERIVVDGSSSDGTADEARDLGAERVRITPPGRARQLAAGLEEASGEAVLFLHADTRLEAGWERAVRRALGDEGVVGGAFRLAFESDRRVYRILERGVALRCRLGLPYGDQALFARRKALVDAGGIPPTPIFEDLDLAWRLRRLGRLALLPERAFTSPRRYEHNGVVRTVVRNNLALAAWWLGLDRERVAAWYRARPAR